MQLYKQFVGVRRPSHTVLDDASGLEAHPGFPHLVKQRISLKERYLMDSPAVLIGVSTCHSRRKLLVSGVKIVMPQGDLLEMTLTLRPARRFPCRLDRRQNQRQQHAADRH